MPKSPGVFFWVFAGGPEAAPKIPKAWRLEVAVALFASAAVWSVCEHGRLPKQNGRFLTGVVDFPDQLARGPRARGWYALQVFYTRRIENVPSAISRTMRGLGSQRWARVTLPIFVTTSH